MPYTLQHRVLPEYLEVHIQGTIVPGNEFKEATQRWNKVASLCVNVDRRLILAFVDLKGQHPLDSKFKLVDEEEAFNWSQDYKLSMVVKDEDQYNHLSFTETVMNNLGYEMKLFTNRKEAKKWLLSETSQ